MRYRVTLTAFAGLMALSSAQSVMAADIYAGDPNGDVQPAYEPVAQGALWDNLYGGVYGGLNWKSVGVMGSGDIGIEHQQEGGIYAGINRQFGDSFVGGVEVMGGYHHGKDNDGGITAEQDWETSLRARMGYAFEENLVYGLAGVNATRLELSTPGASDTNWLTGYTVGAGIERKLTDAISGRVEYDYTHYGKENFDLGPDSTKARLGGHGIKVGVGVNF